jgi:hypothetical protein
MTYNGYPVGPLPGALPHHESRGRNRGVRLVDAARVHAVDLRSKFMAFRLLSSVPHSVFVTLLYLRLRRLIPLAIAHALMDSASVLIGVTGR